MSQDQDGPDPSRENLSFEDRLKAARSKQGLDAPPKSVAREPSVRQSVGGGSGRASAAQRGVSARGLG